MILNPVAVETLKALPTAIWMPGGASPSVYRGTPLEMVAGMSAEMEPNDLPPRMVISAILEGLKRNRGIDIRLPDVRSTSLLAGLFIYALLDRGIGRPVAAV